MKNILNRYLKEVHELFDRGDAREESFYPTLEKLIASTAVFLEKKKIDVTILPKKTEGGNPDFRIWDGKSKIVGYIEAKNIEADLDVLEKNEQITRYIKTFPNFILTDFLEFRLYRDGVLVDSVCIGRKHTLVKVGAKPAVENEEKFKTIMEKYFSFSFPRNLSAQRLAEELAKRTRFLRDQVIIEVLEDSTDKAHNHIAGYFEAFNKYLIYGLTKESFADLYSQTVTYGLFAARTRCDGEFNRKNAVEYIPQTIGILHDLFKFISYELPSNKMGWIIDDISDVLASVSVSLILNEFYRHGKGEDPVIHFYETFLSQYDPDLREKRGVYYTPEPVVSFIVRSINSILKDRFNRPDGLADIHVKILDPAAGTLTFIAEAVKLALEEFTGKYGEGVKEDFVKSHLLKNFYAFELMMAPYAIGHLKMSYILEEKGITLKEEERFNLFLTNTLETHDIEQTNLPGMYSLSVESRLAGVIKKETPILVILGNPPYSGISINKGTWITEEIETYKYVDGEHFKERKHWLQDDYVKFFRFAQWKIDQNGEGILGFITNHSYLDNPTFRGMRQSLMKSFDEIYILDLHGSTTKKEKCPDGSKDENVFDIKQGVAVTLLIKRKGINNGCKIYHSDKWGLREEKYNHLLENDFKSIEWEELKPESSFYFFKPRKEKNKNIYESFLKLDDIFDLNVTGIISARDKLVIDFDKKGLIDRLEIFRSELFTDEMILNMFKLKDTRGWGLKEARKRLKSIAALETNIEEILYRPFDIRFIYYSNDLVDWPRMDIMNNMLKKNIALICPKQFKEEPGALVTDRIIGHKTVSAYDVNYLFPLYSYKKDLFNGNNNQTPGTNISLNVIEKIHDAFRGNRDISPEQVFYYIYAVLYSNIYRRKYAEFLRSDFPRVPFTKDYDLFITLSELGKSLVDIHLLKSDELNQPFSKFAEPGGNIVEKINYNADE
ncbi:MAG TPA: type ISP restriction/modification enzyme, partial [Candidatus Deferrimicrobium sp.]|nr:type ISP restriction/modification enzyme [Candidatus Deferrimicrobium sp.]